MALNVTGDLTACISTVVSYAKDFSGGLRDNGQPELGKDLTTSIRNVTYVSPPPPEARILSVNMF